MENHNDLLTQTVLDKLTKVCICKSINRASIKKAVIKGATTVQDVKKATGAGSGSCHGRRCTPKIEMILNQVLKEKEE